MKNDTLSLKTYLSSGHLSYCKRLFWLSTCNIRKVCQRSKQGEPSKYCFHSPQQCNPFVNLILKGVYVIVLNNFGQLTYVARFLTLLYDPEKRYAQAQFERWHHINVLMYVTLILQLRLPYNLAFDMLYIFLSYNINQMWGFLSEII